MKRKRLLQRDAVTDLALPFGFLNTRLQLLGFLLPYDRKLPAFVAMFCTRKEQYYVITMRGEAMSAPRDSHGSVRQGIDLPVSAAVSVGRSEQGNAKHFSLLENFFSLEEGAAEMAEEVQQVCVGMVAFALSEERVFVGPDWAVRKSLRTLLAQEGGLSEDDRVKIQVCLRQEAAEVLAVRHWDKGLEAVDRRRQASEKFARKGFSAMVSDGAGDNKILRKQALLLQDRQSREAKSAASEVYYLTKAWALLSKSERGVGESMVAEVSKDISQAPGLGNRHGHNGKKRMAESSCN